MPSSAVFGSCDVSMALVSPGEKDVLPVEPIGETGIGGGEAERSLLGDELSGAASLYEELFLPFWECCDTFSGALMRLGSDAFVEPPAATFWRGGDEVEEASEGPAGAVGEVIEGTTAKSSSISFSVDVRTFFVATPGGGRVAKLLLEGTVGSSLEDCSGDNSLFLAVFRQFFFDRLFLGLAED